MQVTIIALVFSEISFEYNKASGFCHCDILSASKLLQIPVCMWYLIIRFQ